jgi:hypothetical protein
MSVNPRTDPIAELREFFDSYAPEINYSAELTAALAELERRARIEARLADELKNTAATLLLHHDDELGWAALLWYPDLPEGDRPPPSFEDFSDRSHDPDYHVALERELDKAGAP